MSEETCQARRYVARRGLSLCSLASEHDGDHAWTLVKPATTPQHRSFDDDADDVVAAAVTGVRHREVDPVIGAAAAFGAELGRSRKLGKWIVIVVAALVLASRLVPGR